MRLGWWSIRIFFGGLFVLAILVARSRYDGVGFALQRIGVEIYTLHRETGGWPTGNLTLIEPARSMIDRGLIVVVPNAFLHANPKENAHTILAYQAKGLRTRLGFTYVCWGDLRTEVITRWQLQKALDRTGQPN